MGKKLKKIHPVRSIILVLMALIFLVPFLLIISISITDAEAITKYGYKLIPKALNFDAYYATLKNPTQLIRSYEVTIFFATVATVLSLIVMSLLAYALSRREFKLRKGISVYLLITMLFHGGLVPSYILITKYLQLNNTIWVYIIPSLVSAWHVIIIRTFFQGLPDGIVEAARIDGCNEFRTFVSIAIPMMKPAIAVQAIFAFIASWNNYYTPNMILINVDLKEKTLPMMVAGIQASDKLNDFGAVYLALALAIIPIIIAYVFLSRFIIAGVALGGVKE